MATHRKEYDSKEGESVRERKEMAAVQKGKLLWAVITTESAKFGMKRLQT